MMADSPMDVNGGGTEDEDERDYRLAQLAKAQFETGFPLGAREGWQPSEAWEKKRRNFLRGVLFVLEVAALVWCRLHVGIVQTGDAEALLHITFENLLDEEIATELSLGRFLLVEGDVRIYDETGILMSGGSMTRGFVGSQRRIARNPIKAHAFYTMTLPIWIPSDSSGRWHFGSTELEPGKTYTFEVDYLGLTSNRFAWTVPAAPDADRQGL